MKKSLLILFMLITSTLFADSSNSNSVCVYFFYGDGCPHCGKVEPFIDGIEVKYPNVEVHKIEIYKNRPNLVLFNKFAYAYGIPEAETGVPTVFMGNTYLAGDVPILEKLEKMITESNGSPCPNLEDIANPAGEHGASSPTKPIGELQLVTVIGAALVDSINPCAFAVILILLGTLLSGGDKDKALKGGLAFTLSIYIVYFLFGLGVMSALQISGLSYWFYKIIGLLALALGLLNIKDSIWYGGGGFVMEIPRSWRPALKKLLATATSPAGAFAMGFIVCLFELPCTGGPYVFILGLLAERSTMMAAIPILLLYNVFFVVPLLLITFVMYSGFKNIEEMNEFKEKNLRQLHLVAGLIMVALGLMMVFNIV